MPKTLTDVASWDDVVVPVDSDARNAASVETPFQALANRTKVLQNDFVLTGSQVVNIPPVAATPHTPQGGVAPAWQMLSGNPRTVQSKVDEAKLVVDLAAYLPDGAALTEIEVDINEGSTRSDGDRSEIRLIVTPSVGGLDSQYSCESDTTVNGGSTTVLSDHRNAISSSEWFVPPMTIDKSTHSYFLVITAGKDSPSGHASDDIEGVRLYFNAPNALA